jgi:hypothetical protein
METEKFLFPRQTTMDWAAFFLGTVLDLYLVSSEQWLIFSTLFLA